MSVTTVAWFEPRIIGFYLYLFFGSFLHVCNEIWLYPSPLPSSTIPLAWPHPNCMFFFSFNEPIKSNLCAWMWAIHWSMGNLPVATSAKKNDPPPATPTVLCKKLLGERCSPAWGWSIPSTLRFLPGLILCKSYAVKHSYCELMNAMAESRPKDSTPPLFSTSSGFYISYRLPWDVPWALALGGGHDKDVSFGVGPGSWYLSNT